MKFCFGFVFLLSVIFCSAQDKFQKNIYQYIENPSVLEIGQEPGHAPSVPFDNPENALHKNRKESPNFISLNGSWKFFYAENPASIPVNFFKLGYNDRQWGDIKVPGNWEMQGYGDPMFRNVSQPFKANPPKVPKDYNPVGSYRTSFSIPSNWREKQVFLRMEGTTSATFVWLNGKEVGFNKGANEPAEYNLTPYLNPGKNTLAVQVYKYSDGTYLEDQDFWRLAGIFRDVSLVATPTVHIRDYAVTTDFDEQYKDAILTIKTDLKNYLSVKKEGYQIKATLYNQDFQKVQQELISPVVNLSGSENREIILETKVKNPAKWSAEYPSLYYLTFELIQNGKTEEVISSCFGFKETKIQHQVFLLNGVAIKLNGVNSHMQHPALGHTMDEETIRKDFILMKRFNINCVRMSHYPPIQEYLDLADEMGMYIVNETGDESHATEFISEKPEWRNAYVARVQKMVKRDRNHPCVLFWSAGNESGFGNNICEVIKEGKHLDPTRSWMYGGNTHDVDWKNEVPCEEIIGPRYPTPYELETRIAQVPESQDSRPSFMDEYIAATGNSVGGMDEYWKIIRQYPRLMGGALWDWVSPGIKEKIRLLKDESPNPINTSIKGRAIFAEGKFGRSIQLNGHDQWIETYRDPKLDLKGNQLTLSFWVYPNHWNGNGTFLVKGNYQYGIIQKDEKTLEFYLSDPNKGVLLAPVPEGWEHSWHHLAGIYDGQQMSFYIDGKKVANRAFAGNISNRPYPVSLGYNTENDGQEYSQNMSNARFDRVSIFNKAIPINRLLDKEDQLLKKESLLWLDFENEELKGEYYSLGIGARSYGLVWPDRTPQPELWQVKKSAQPVLAQWSDLDKKEVEISNQFGFTNLNQLKSIWKLTADNDVLQQGELNLNLKPGEKSKVVIPFKDFESKAGVSYRLLLSFQTLQDQFWAEKGYEVAFEQLELPAHPKGTVLSDHLPPIASPLLIQDSKDSIIISGQDFSYGFDKNNGTLMFMKYQKMNIICKGPILNVWRAPLANETDSWATGGSNLTDRRSGMGRGPVNNWYSLGLDQLTTKLDKFEYSADEPGKVIIRVTNHSEGSIYHTAFTNDFSYTIYSSGEMETDHTVTPHGVMPAWLPRVGLKWNLDPSFSKVSWNGRGPFENYPDRKTGAKLGIYQSDVKDMTESYLKPQDYGCRTDNQWVRFENGKGTGVSFSGSGLFNFSAQIYDTDHLSRAQYPYQLKPSGNITLNFDYATSGVGCTAISVLNEYRVLPKVYHFITKIKPWKE